MSQEVKDIEIIFPVELHQHDAAETEAIVHQAPEQHSLAEETVVPGIWIGIGAITLVALKYSRARFLQDPK